MSEEQIMADILDKLVTARMWGAGHQDIDQLKGWLISQLKKNGKRVEKAINQFELKFAKEHKHQINRHSLRFFGTCNSCQNKYKETHNKF